MAKKLDYLGISISLLCLIHCLGLPLVLMSLPILARYYLTHPYFHVALALVIVPVALIALWRGFRQHQKISIFILGLLGVILILVASVTRVTFDLFRMYEPIFTIFGSVILSISHVLNLRQVKTCQLPHLKTRT